MAMSSQLQHRQTFARIRQAVTSDIDELIGLQHSLSPLHPIPETLWDHFIRSRGARVTLAVEGGIVVGAAVEVHRLRSPVARLFALGVVPSARRRGIGSLLLDAVINQARAEGAALLWAEAPAEQKALRHLIEGAGFHINGKDGGRTVRYGRSLWCPPRSASAQEPPPSLLQDNGDSGVCALMMAMAAIDGTVLPTPGLTRVLQYEAGDGSSQAVGLALSATRRGFRVILHPPEAMQPIDGLPIVALDTPPTPEQLIGYLSRGNMPMLHCHLTRLHRRQAAHWLLITGFDGYLFRIVDPQARANGPDAAVTMGELRACLRAGQGHQPTVLVLAKSGG